MMNREPLDTTRCSYCDAPYKWKGIEHNSRGKGTKYACEHHKHLITVVVAELAPSKAEPRVKQEGLSE